MVNHQTFDFILFAILGIPFILGLVQLFRPNFLEPLIRERNGSGFADNRRNNFVERPVGTETL